jgi:ABC-2 type transport system permease protein
VLVAPIPRSALVLGKVLGGSVLATIQGVLLLGLAPLIGIPLGFGQAVAAACVVFLCSFGLTALGFAVAWRMDSSQGFHAFMGLFLFPMWLLSGAFFPAEGTPAILRAVMAANPLTYAVAALQHVMGAPRAGNAPSLGLCIAVTVAFCVAGFAASAALTRRREREAAHP